MTDLNEMAASSFEVLQRREANGAVNISTEPWRMLEHTASEVVEVSEAYSCYVAQHGNKASKDSLASELADVIICALCFAAAMGLDIDKAVANKMRVNENRACKIGDKL